MCISNNDLKRGDIVVLDNAKIHVSQDAMAYRERIEHEYGIYFINQPKYSPEYNACEYVFGVIKGKARDKRPSNLSGFVTNALRAVSKQQIHNFYRHVYNNMKHET